MILNRISCWTLLAVGGFTLLTGGETLAQVDKDTLPRKVDAAVAEVRKRSDKDANGIPEKELPEARKRFTEFAKYYAEVVTHPLIYRAAQQDPTLKINSSGRAIDTTQRQIPTIDEVIKEFDTSLLNPNPFVRSAYNSTIPKVTTNHADSIRELGAAFDAVLKPIIEGHAERVVRINAMRIYAAVCRTGAAAHWPTVTAFLTSENVPTEIKYYALEAAANLLSAYDMFEYKTRRHGLAKEPRSESNKEIGALVVAVQECVTNPNVFLTGINALRDKKLENATADQIDVIRFVRKQAIKALAQVRFIVLPGPGEEPIYPAMTLIRVCMSDPTLGYALDLLPTPTPGECGEAVLGLANMSHVVGGNPTKDFNADALVEAMTAGLITFATPRTEAANQSLPWRDYARRLSATFKKWRPLFDPIFDPATPNLFIASAVPTVVNDFISRVQTTIITPLEKTNASGEPDPNVKLDIGVLTNYLRGLRENPKRTGMLISNVPQTRLPGLAKK